MNLGPTIRRLVRILATALAGMAGTLLALAAAAPAALASGPGPLPPGGNKHPPLPSGRQPGVQFLPGWNKHPPLPAHAHTAVAGGLPRWQITLIVAAAVLLAAALAVTYRLRAARRRVSATAA